MAVTTEWLGYSVRYMYVYGGVDRSAIRGQVLMCNG